MARQLYSTQFFNHASLSGGPVDEFVVPVGFIAVVKSIVITWGIVTVSGVDAWVQDDTLCKLYRYTWFTSTSSLTNNGGSSAWWGMAVLLSGQTLQSQAGTGTVDITCAGYLLSEP